MNSKPFSNERREFREIESQGAGANPDNPPWNSGVAILVWVASVVLVVVVPALVLMPYLFLHLEGTLARTKVADLATKDPTAVLIQMLAILPVHLITFLICWYVVTNFRRFPFRETLGWRSGGMRWWHHLLVLVGFVSVMIVVGNLSPEQENDVLRIIKSSKWALYTVAFFATFTAPLIEEVVYRGILYSAFKRSIGTFRAVALVTLLFALVHVPQYYPSVSTILLLSMLSLILTLVRVFSGNLLPCIILHTVFNGFQSATLIVEHHLGGTSSANDSTSFFLGF